MRRVTIISTGGTIEKTYDEYSGSLQNRESIVRTMLDQLRLEDTQVCVASLMHKDSLDLTDNDRAAILASVGEVIAEGEPSGDFHPIIILHGTDTLEVTGEMLHHQLGGGLPIPVVLVGAMRPYEMKRSDALQNLTEAIFATGSLKPGVYAVAHGRALRFPGVVKDRSHGTFVNK